MAQLLKMVFISCFVSLFGGIVHILSRRQMGRIES